MESFGLWFLKPADLCSAESCVVRDDVSNCCKGLAFVVDLWRLQGWDSSLLTSGSCWSCMFAGLVKDWGPVVDASVDWCSAIGFRCAAFQD